ncbi:hypothetical protein LCGC14_0666630 [marine sediment metagenome]|uniref:Uncharacterized protein n=1 Tax=marine sediment metagenome TaxID=412755 RepID=A0A0F9QX57_9ZZZZ
MQEPTLTDAQRDLLRGRGIPTDRVPRAPQERTIGTGYFSTIDSHELNQIELENSNMVIGADGFIYIPIFGERLGLLDDGSTGMISEITGFELAPKWIQEEVLGAGGGGGGRTGPTAAELAIDRSRVQATNLSTFIQGTVSQLSNEIDAGRLEMDQALNEFNKKLDAFAEGGKQFQGIQPYTIPIGAEYIPGFGPGEIGEHLGIAPEKVIPIQFDPFGMATEIVNQSPDLTDIGVPSGDALAEALEIARQFVGG